MPECPFRASHPNIAVFKLHYFWDEKQKTNTRSVQKAGSEFPLSALLLHR